mgnify:CR=1 FL=1
MKEDKKKKPDLSAKVTELENDVKRIQADFINYRRRSEDERTEIIDIAKTAVMTSLLPVLDNFKRAAEHLPKELESNQWAKGIEGIEKQFEKAMEELGVKKFESLGQKFDPHRHEAVGEVESDQGEDTVVEELQPGYELNGRILRPAIVKVAR